MLLRQPRSDCGITRRNHNVVGPAGAGKSLDEERSEMPSANEADGGHGISSRTSPTALAVAAISSSVWTMLESECSVAEGLM